MNDLQVFKNDDFGEVRMLQIEGEPWFVGKDVADILGYKNSQKAVRDHVDSDDKLTERIVLAGQKREIICINESGLYSLILSSKLETAKKFKRWVTSEVLPSVRNHGAYLTAEKLEEALTDPDTLIKLATTLKEEKARNKALELKIESDAPKVIFADAVATSNTSILVRELAKLITQNEITIGQKKLFEWLREKEFLIKKAGSDYNLPTQKAMNMKLFEIKETAVSRSDGNIDITRTPKVTGKGQTYFINTFLKGATENV